MREQKQFLHGSKYKCSIGFNKLYGMKKELLKNCVDTISVVPRKLSDNGVGMMGT